MTIRSARHLCLALALLAGGPCVAGAATFVDPITWDSPRVLSGDQVFAWDHAMPATFSEPPDVATAAVLTIDAKKVSGQNETLVIQYSMTFDVKAAQLGGHTYVFDGFESVFVDWAEGDPLHVVFQAHESGSSTIELNSSRFVLTYEENGAPVPLPPAALLLGCGLGLGWLASRRRRRPEPVGQQTRDARGSF